MSAAPLTNEKLAAAMEVALVAANKAAALMNECFDKRDAAIEAEAEGKATNSAPSSSTANVEIALTKSSGVDLVTEYDQMCEKIVLETLMTFEPSWKIVSEESHPDAPLEDDPTWIVDPIDGTTAFVHRSFDCCVSVGLAVNKKPVLGVVVIPRMNETFTAIIGQGAKKNGKPIRASGIKDMSKAVVVTHSPYVRTPECIGALSAINTELLVDLKVHAVRSYSSAAMDICSVACGRVDLYFEVGPHSWDMCAAAVILREAGGVIHSIWDENLRLDNKEINGDELKKAAETLDMKSRGYTAGATVELSRHGVELNLKHKYGEILLNAKK